MIALIAIIAGPLLLFSGLNPLSEPNPVTGASIRLNLIANLTDEEEGATNVFNLFETNRFITVEPISDANFKRISGERVVRNLDRELFQQVQMSPISDSVWSISPPVQRQIFGFFRDAVDNTGALPINLELEYIFNRDQPAELQQTDKALPIVNLLANDVADREKILDVMVKALDPGRACNPTEDLS